MADKKPIKFIKNFDISQLIPNPRNPRKNDHIIDYIVKSIEQFKFVTPIIINKNNEIVDGHARYKAAMQINRKTVPVIVAPHLTDEDMIGYGIAANQTAQLAEWDYESLQELISELNESDFDMGTLGFDESELDEIYNYTPDVEGKTAPDDIPDPPKKANTKPGDIYKLGEHRLMCGNSRDQDDVKRLVNKQQASLFATDPPYFVDYTGADRPGGGKDWTDVYHEVDIPDADQFMLDFYNAAFPHLKKNTAFYLWHASKNRVGIEKICHQLGFQVHQQIIWVKPVSILTFSMYSWRHEPCLMMWLKGNKPKHIKQAKNLDTIWRFDYAVSKESDSPDLISDVWELDWEGKKRNPGLYHPTVKPTEIFAIPMRVHTRPGDICYEPFSGSGSQIIAGERLGRRVYAMEIEPVFCDVAVERWEQFTGGKAKRVRK